MLKYLQAALAIIVFSTAVYAQDLGYRKGPIVLGPTIGLGIGNGLGFGATGDYGFNDNISFGMDIAYSSFTQDLFGPSNTYFSYSLIGVLLGASYHFSPKEAFDPYVKVGAGYFNWGVDYYENGKKSDLLSGLSAAYASGIGFTGQVGARYYFSPNLAARVSLGYPMYVSTGIDFVLGNTGKQGTPSGATTGDNGGNASSTEVKKPARDAWGLYVGPYFSFVGGGINTVVSSGRRTGVSVSALPEYGGTLYVPFTRGGSVGLGLSVGMIQYAYLSKPNSDQVSSAVSVDAYTIVEKYNFLEVFPHINLAGFVLGVGFQSPSSGSTKLTGGREVNVSRDTTASAMRNRTPSETNESPAIGLSGNGLGLFYTGTNLAEPSPAYDKFLASLTAIKLGTDVALFDDSWGRVNLHFMASYPLSGLYSDARNYIFSDEFAANTNTWSYNANNNAQPVTVSIGTSVYFKIPIVP